MTIIDQLITTDENKNRLKIIVCVLFVKFSV